MHRLKRTGPRPKSLHFSLSPYLVEKWCVPLGVPAKSWSWQCLPLVMASVRALGVPAKCATQVGPPSQTNITVMHVFQHKHAPTAILLNGRKCNPMKCLSSGTSTRTNCDTVERAQMQPNELLEVWDIDTHEL